MARRSRGEGVTNVVSRGAGEARPGPGANFTCEITVRGLSAWRGWHGSVEPPYPSRVGRGRMIM